MKAFEIEERLKKGQCLISVDMSVAGTYFYIGKEAIENRISYAQFLKFKPTCTFFDQHGSAIRFSVTRKVYWRGEQFPSVKYLDKYRK